ncbi:endonuclease domain-containing protein [Streptomyces fildesensis]|uniref:Endonuclease domain-containing protein n=1 Tax=Streptomyces fildesensis TaxID=375757 RepID=A0ABW8C559_9ACTN
MLRTSYARSYKRAVSSRLRAHRPECSAETSQEHVDHRRGPGRVRGVLCLSCDAAPGQFNDRSVAMRRAVAYVEGNVWKPTLVAPGVCQLPS